MSASGYTEAPGYVGAAPSHASSPGHRPPATTTNTLTVAQDINRKRPAPPSYKVNWNDKFQKLISHYRTLLVLNENSAIAPQHHTGPTPAIAVPSGIEAISDVYLASLGEILAKLRTLYSEFSQAASELAKIIIAEEELPDSQRSIPLAPVGGIAGGFKYLHAGIFFKFATTSPDHHALYDSHTAASKASIHEFRGACAATSALLNLGLHFPLIAVVRYAGRCLVATAALPIEGIRTLVYGSPDAANTVVKSHPKVASRVKEMAFVLNLDYRRMRIQSGKTARIWGPCDMEAHIGTDGRFYIVDTARLFPSEAVLLTCGKGSRDDPRANVHLESAKLTRLLRPELVAANPVSLCPDALTALMDKQSDAEQPKRKMKLNMAVIDATARLIQHVVPQVAHHLDLVAPGVTGVSIGELGEWVGREAHKRGVNLRFLGAMGHHCKHSFARKLVCMMMVSRVIKIEIREAMRMVGIIHEDHTVALRRVVANFLNSALFLETHRRERYWPILQQKLADKYNVLKLPQVSNLVSRDFLLDLEIRRGVFELVQRQLVCEISFADDVEDKLMCDMPLTENDVTQLNVDVRTLNIMNMEEAKYLLYLAGDAPDSEEAAKYFSEAYALVEEYLATKPDDQRALNNQIQMLLAAAKHIHRYRLSHNTNLRDSRSGSSGDDEVVRVSPTSRESVMDTLARDSQTYSPFLLSASKSNANPALGDQMVLSAPSRLVSPLTLTPREMLQLAYAKCQEVIGGKWATCRNDSVLLAASQVLQELAKYLPRGDQRKMAEEEAQSLARAAARMNPFRKRMDLGASDISWDGLTSEDDRSGDDDSTTGSSDWDDEDDVDSDRSPSAVKHTQRLSVDRAGLARLNTPRHLTPIMRKISKIKFPVNIKPLSRNPVSNPRLPSPLASSSLSPLSSSASVPTLTPSQSKSQSLAQNFVAHTSPPHFTRPSPAPQAPVVPMQHLTLNLTPPTSPSLGGMPSSSKAEPNMRPSSAKGGKAVTLRDASASIPAPVTSTSSSAVPANVPHGLRDVMARSSPTKKKDSARSSGVGIGRGTRVNRSLSVNDNPPPMRLFASTGLTRSETSPSVSLISSLSPPRPIAVQFSPAVVSVAPDALHTSDPSMRGSGSDEDSSEEEQEGVSDTELEMYRARLSRYDELDDSDYQHYTVTNPHTDDDDQKQERVYRLADNNVWERQPEKHRPSTARRYARGDAAGVAGYGQGGAAGGARMSKQLARSEPIKRGGQEVMPLRKTRSGGPEEVAVVEQPKEEKMRRARSNDKITFPEGHASYLDDLRRYGYEQQYESRLEGRTPEGSRQAALVAPAARAATGARRSRRTEDLHYTSDDLGTGGWSGSRQTRRERRVKSQRAEEKKKRKKKEAQDRERRREIRGAGEKARPLETRRPDPAKTTLNTQPPPHQHHRSSSSHHHSMTSKSTSPPPTHTLASSSSSSINRDRDERDRDREGHRSHRRSSSYGPEHSDHNNLHRHRNEYPSAPNTAPRSARQSRIYEDTSNGHPPSSTQQHAEPDRFQDIQAYYPSHQGRVPLGSNPLEVPKGATRTRRPNKGMRKSQSNVETIRTQPYSDEDEATPLPSPGTSPSVHDPGQFFAPVYSYAHTRRNSKQKCIIM
eukprot:TRINITY_DN134_c1_g1_i4.p1 TRINITY_DN134_c1_g1~~TRINITY_DN134_c1_g1_i4.p1  ORF type:complete len:1620 (+),score=434.88 TRINITY_DN134_c1_g1_i4:206-5065(+)